MATVEEYRKQFEELGKRARTVADKKSSLKGQFEAKKQELTALIDDIKAAGYDPKNLKEEKDKIERSLVEQIAAYDKDLTEIETALKELEPENR